MLTMMASLFAAVGLALVPAQPEPVQLSWIAPASCPTAGEVIEFVRGRVPPSSEPSPQTLIASGVITRRDQVFVLSLQVDGSSSSTRTLEDPDCKAVSDAAGLILALAIAAERGAQREVEADPAAPATIADPPAQLDQPETPAQAPSDSVVELPAQPASPPVQVAPSQVLGLRVSGGPALDVGRRALPLGFEVEATPWVQLGSFRAELAIRWQPVRASRDTEGVGVDVGRWAAGIKACGVPGIGRFAFPLCGGAEAGQMYGRGVGQIRNLSTRVTWGAAVGSASVEVDIGAGFGAAILTHTGLAVLRPKFINDQDQVYRASRFNFSFLAGVFFRWPQRNAQKVSK